MTSFARVYNIVKTTLAANRSPGGPLVVVDASAIVLSPGEWVRVTLVRNSDGGIAILKCTAVSGNTLTVESAIEDTTDLAAFTGDKVEVRITAGALEDIHDAVVTLETQVTAKADASALTTHTTNTSNPHSVTAAQVGAYTTSQVDTALAGKASTSHTHAESDVTGLVADLASKASATTLTTHTSNTSNPHSVTASQVGAYTTSQVDTALAGKLSTTGDGSGLTNLNASALASGTVSTARLGSGTASSSTYLRGDGTWASPGGGGTVTSVALAVPTGLGVTGSPITGSGTITITTALSGVLKGTGTGITTASAGTDYLTPTGNGSGLTALNASALASGTVSTARLGSGTASSSTYLRGDGTWATPGGGGTVTSVDLTMPSGFVVSGNPVTGSGTLTVSTALSGVLKGTGSGIGVASAGTDYLTPTGNGSGLTALNASALATGTVSTARLGSGTASSSTFLRGDNTWASTGTVTSVALAVPTGLGVTGSPVTGSGTITITTALSGLIKGTGTGFTAASAGTDYLSPTGDGSGLTNLSATALATGTVSTARLGSGTASSSTFLRGDNTWSAVTASPGGSTTQVQFNDAGSLGGDAGLVYDKTNDTLTIAGSADAKRLALKANATQTSNMLEIQNSSGTPLTIIDGNGYGLMRDFTFLLAIGGAATTGTSKTNLVVVPRNGKIVKAFINAKTAPTGAAFIVDINKNGTSIWASTQANRVQLAISATSGTQTSFDTTSLAEGDTLTIDIDQIGSTVAGQDITVTLHCQLRNQ